MSELKSGTKIKGRYTLKEFKGSGSFGEVWLAHDEVLDCDVAIKIYISLDPQGVEEFKSEYITTQGIYHPNLLTTTYFDVWGQRPYLVMNYCEKGSTTALAGEMDEYSLWQFIHDVAAGLKYLHSLPEPIIHQDIKPDNILIDDSNHYLITDFGISKKIRSTMRRQSRRAVGAGATAYMGPERFESDPSPVKASDIWSLGASIYELATGQLPFNGMGGGMQKNGAELPVLDNQWSKDMTMVMQSCLAKETWDRPTAEQLEKFSDAILKGEPAELTWNIPTAESAENEDNIVTTDTSGSDYSFEDSVYENHSNKKRIWITIGIIIVAISILILKWPSNDKEEPVIIPEDTVSDVEEVVDTVSEQNVIEMPIVAPQDKKTPVKVEPKVQPKSQKEIKQPTNEESKAEDYADKAQKFLEKREYNKAEEYALKARSSGDKKGGQHIIQTLKNLGYYDDKPMP